MTRREEAVGILERGLRPTSNHLTPLPQIRKLRSAMKRALGKLRRAAPARQRASVGKRGTAPRRATHEKCRDACTKEMRKLRRSYPGTRIEIAVRSLEFFIGGAAGRYEANNMFGHVWAGPACCKWRARAKAAEVLASRRSHQRS